MNATYCEGWKIKTRGSLRDYEAAFHYLGFYLVRRSGKFLFRFFGSSMRNELARLNKSEWLTDGKFDAKYFRDR